MDNYKGIVFAKGYNRSFAEFKEEFASTHIFKEVPHKQREAELKKAYKIATNGNISTGSKQSKKTKP